MNIIEKIRLTAVEHKGKDQDSNVNNIDVLYGYVHPP